MTKKDKLEYDLYNSIQTISAIHCSKCKKQKDYPNSDGWDAVEAAINDGWYATENNTYCPDCNKKRLKK